MDFDNNMPIYIQIMNYIKVKLVKGELKAGAKMMSVRDMSEEFKVNPNTIQRAYQELEREGITYTKRGRGTFITEDKEIIVNLKEELSKDIVSSFVLNMLDLGFSKEEILDNVLIEANRRGNNE